MARARRASVIAVVVLLGSAGCGGSKRANPPAASSTASTSAVATSSTTAAGTTTTRARGTTSTTGKVTGPAVVVRHGAESRRWIALTFDAGSDRGNTEAILDLLAAHHLHATFSLTGNFARANATLVLRIAREGHVIVNHSDTHPSFTGYSTHSSVLSPAERVDQLSRADAAITAITGSSPRPWFRPPYGDIDAATPGDVARAGYGYVLLWTVDSLGWKGIAPAEVVTRCLDGATPGGILLLHVGSASTDAAALPQIIDGLQSRGYELVTVATPGFIR